MRPRQRWRSPSRAEVANAMKYRLSVREEAENDMAAAFAFYESQQPGLGIRFHDELAGTLQRIEENPRQCPATQLPRYRKAVMNIFPFCVYYTVAQQKIAVVPVHDARQGLPWHAGRVR